MSDQPKSTDEWTVERIEWFKEEYLYTWKHMLSEAINASLAKCRQQAESMLRTSTRVNEQLRDQLAAERAKNTNLSALLDACEQQLAAESEEQQDGNPQEYGDSN